MQGMSLPVTIQPGFTSKTIFFTKYHFGILCCVQCELLQE